jgi:L-aminopeptidase/D-esterase-like protein
LSTANAEALAHGAALRQAAFVPDEAMDPLFTATIQAVDEAVLNSMVANETMIGADDVVVHALPHDRVRTLMLRR